MNIRSMTTMASLAVMLAAVAPAYADEGIDNNGMSSIGIDVSRIGGGQAAVQGYLASLSPEALRSVIGGCQTAVTNAGNYSSAVLSFCATVNSSEPSGGVALGFAPSDRNLESPTSGAITPQAGGFPEDGNN